MSQTTTPRSPESSLRRQWRDCVVQQTDPRKITFLVSLVRNVWGNGLRVYRNGRLGLRE
ncbi:MAG: hypothetical protein LBT05_06960 [Planctomycetaceae bacterium]|nr:hypothetical protein [Planctomycetaceae bacterium]